VTRTRIGQGSLRGGLQPTTVTIPARMPSSPRATGTPRCIAVCEIRQEPSFLAPVVRTFTSATPFYVNSVSIDGWASIFAQLDPATGVGGFTRVEQLSGVLAPSPFGDLGRLPTERETSNPPIANVPEAPTFRPRRRLRRLRLQSLRVRRHHRTLRLPPQPRPRISGRSRRRRPRTTHGPTSAMRSCSPARSGLPSSW
jgi:hypothetical protein